MDQMYRVKLEAFEGPLDLLLHLIQQYEIDIYDIPVSTITEQYMTYIHTMKELRLDIASEYLVMAATLLAMKSYMLIPRQELEPEDLDLEEEDPRDELMRRLIEYRKYKEAAHELQQRELDQNQVYTRPPTGLEEYKNSDSSPAPLEVSLFDMIAAMKKMLERKKWDEPLETRVQKQEIPIQQRMEEILLSLEYSSEGILFHQLFPIASRNHIVVTFIAILELMKGHHVYCVQNEHFGEIRVFKMEEVVWKK
ncbi:segregation/condensation protein A [Bacillaceae bacterium S4-13-56]